MPAKAASLALQCAFPGITSDSSRGLTCLYVPPVATSGKDAAADASTVQAHTP